MDLALGNSPRIVGAGSAPVQSCDSTCTGGTRVGGGVETDVSGAEFAGYPVAVAGGLVRWVEGATVFAPEPLTSAVPPPGMLIASNGSLRATLHGSDSGATRARLTGVTGVSDIGSAAGLLVAAKATARAERAAS